MQREPGMIPRILEPEVMDSVEEAWRIVDGVLKSDTPIYEYEPGTWGPKEVDQLVCPPGGWQNPDAS